MLQLLTTLLASLAFLTATSAKIVGFASPATIAPGDTPFFQSLVGGDIDKYLDVSVALGLETAGNWHPPYLGKYLLGTQYIGPAGSNTLLPAYYMFEVPKDLVHGDYVVTAQYISLTGAANLPVVQQFYGNVTVGDTTTSSDMVDSYTPVRNCYYGTGG